MQWYILTCFVTHTYTHAQTILTPKRERDHMTRNRSLSCTPSTFARRSTSEPAAKHQLSFVKSGSADSAHQFPAIAETSPPRELSQDPLPQENGISPTTSSTSVSTPHAKKPRLSKTPALNINDDDKANGENGPMSQLYDSLSALEAEGEGEEEGGEEGGLDSYNIQGALTDELKILQDKNRSLQQQLEGAEKRVGHLMRSRGELEAQVQEITQVRDGREGKEGGAPHEQEAQVQEITQVCDGRTPTDGVGWREERGGRESLTI